MCRIKSILLYTGNDLVCLIILVKPYLLHWTLLFDTASNLET